MKWIVAEHAVAAFGPAIEPTMPITTE